LSLSRGAQWGDEGKGKLVDVLAERADRLAVRLPGKPTRDTRSISALHLLCCTIPESGILHPECVRCAIGNGVVLDLIIAVRRDRTAP
jgi:adenylosuccinate synthase